MKNVVAKFQVNMVTGPRKATRYHSDGTQTQTEAVDIHMYPAPANTPENKEFFANTPGGSIVLQTVNQNAAAYFEQGKQYYVEFREARS